jgi:hypothetical protein
MRISPKLTAGLVATFTATSLHAQAPAPAAAPAAKNLISNGGFESSFARENLWDGVDKAGYLSGERASVPVLTTSGVISETSMPISVAVADMNGDKLPDIVTMDVLSYTRIFFNSGTPTEPKFTVGELAGIFLSRTDPKDVILEGSENAEHARLATRMFPSEILRTGKKDLIVGNYIGEVLLIPNAGSPSTPDFRQPADLSRATIPTMKDSNKKWGNVFAPTTWDWNKDGKEDLLLGEGSYSANNIHLLLNQGSGAKPTFDENNRYAIAFGDGLEQLTPTVVDYNGDGHPDLLVAERSGKIAVYLNKGEPVKMGQPPTEIPFASFISSAGSSSPLSFGGISTVSTGDLNGDGLFDLVVGKTNGRIAVAMNTGTKTEPKFSAPVELKGDVNTPPLAIPSGWDIDYGLKRGNFYGYITTVKAEDDKAADPAEGKAVFKAGYMPSPNKVMPQPTTFTYTPGFAGWDIKRPSFWTGAERQMFGAPARYFNLRQLGRFKFKLNKNYTLTFKVKGKFSDGQAFIGWTGAKTLSEARVTQGGRGSADVRRNEVREDQGEAIKFSGGAAWVEVRKDFKVFLRHKELQELTETTSALLDISFTVPNDGVCYIDDVKLVERP